jgi:hypothetical protein
MWERLQRFRTLDPAARGLFLRAWIALPVISVCLRLRSFGPTQAALRRFLPSDSKLRGPAEGQACDEALPAARMVRAAAYFGAWRFTCLEKSLTLWWLLGRQGIASTVRIGARKSEGKFEAHAWVESGGVALLEPDEPDRHYAAFEGAFSAPRPQVR